MKICIVMLYTPNISSYSKITEQINRKYCNKWQYDFKLYDTLIPNKWATWSKLDAIKKTLFNNDYDYIFWIDSDAFFNNHDIQLENFITTYDMYICDDLPNNLPGQHCIVNTGTMLIKNTKYMQDFINIWLNYDGPYNYQPYHEQTILDYMIKNNIFNCENKIKIYKANTFNSIIYEFHNDDFIIHMMDMDEQNRINIANQKLISISI
jgi:hypothetical protein